MRNDMTRVLVGRPRCGFDYRPARSNDRLLLRLAHEEMEGGEELKLLPRPLGHNRRDSRTHRTPLERFLHKQVGRPWDQVYSDIAHQAPCNTMRGDKLREEVSWMVDTNVVSRDGVLVGRWGYPPSDLFVHPESGILTRPERGKKRRYQPRHEFETVDVDPAHKYVRLDGLWYRVTLSPLPVGNAETVSKLPLDQRYDVVLQQHAFGDERNQPRQNRFVRVWGDHVLASSKSQASRKEIRRINEKLARATSGGVDDAARKRAGFHRKALHACGGKV